MRTWLRHWLHQLNLVVHWWSILKHISMFRASDNAKDVHKVLPAFVRCFIDFIASLTNASCESTVALKTAYCISPYPQGYKVTLFQSWNAAAAPLQRIRATHVPLVCMYNHVQPSKVCWSMLMNLYSEDIQSYKSKHWFFDMHSQGTVHGWHLTSAVWIQRHASQSPGGDH